MLICCSVLSVCATLSAAERVPEYDARTFHETTSIRGASFSSDGSRVLTTSDETGVFNVYSLAVSGGDTVQLTHSTTNAYFGVSYFPQDDRFLFSHDQGGDELNHLYVRELDGTERDLTPGEKLKASFGGWSDDLQHFYVLSNERDPKFFDLYRYDAESYDRELVFRNAGGFTQPVISRDGRWVAVGKRLSNADSDLYVWDAEMPDKPPVHITPHEGDVAHSVAGFSPDSTSLYIASNADSEFDRIWKYDLASKTKELAVEDEWDVRYLDFSWDGQYQVVGVNADARTQVTVTDLETGQAVALPEFPSANVTGVEFSQNGERIAFSVGGDTSPANLHVMEVKSGQSRQLTTSLNPKVKQEHLVNSQVVRYKSFDGLDIPALLYKPHHATDSDKVPALVWVHGGPGGQCRVGYNSVLQFLVNHGYAVLAINNRGSSGYGKTFYHMDDKRHGEIDMQDVVYARRYLEGLAWVDGSKVGIIGGSYGGYLVCSALAFQPEVFDVGIDIFGVTNWVRTLSSIPPWWASARDSLYAELGDPATDIDRLRRISPLFHAKNIRRPLLVIQGANDPRVLQVESDEMVAAVKQNGVPVEYIIFDDEGHGFRNKENRITAAEAYLEFLDTHLKGES